MKRLFLAAVILATCSGCASVPQRDATAALIARHDFKTAAKAAPEWVSAALRQITELEAELEAARK